ncbi:MAG: DUF6542 domain-containing protein [Mycobacterium sp.]
MSAQRARSSVAATHRSAHPNIPGVPWWGAVVIAVTATIIGFAFDAGSGNKELASAFAALYFIGCVAAVLAVQQNSVFTAVVQPPLILFVAVPGAYFLFHQDKIDGVKDILINCGYPLIERFLLMFTTSAVVLLIGAARWYFGRTGTIDAEATGTEESAAPRTGARAKLGSMFGGGTDLTDDEDDAPLKHGIDRPATAPRKATSRRTTGGTPKRPPPSRSRHARPPIDDLDDNPPPPRRRRPPVAGEDADVPPRRRPREPRESREPGARKSTRDYRPREREPREPYERPRRRPNPYESYEPAESFDAPPARPQRPAAGGGTGTHHPVSRVRYRGSEEGGDDRVEHRTRSRARHSLESDRWRYDA